MNIQAIALKTGVPSATLRKWEQRYGVLEPERTPGLHRRYSERDVLRVEWLKARLAEGYRIGEAARLLAGSAEAPPGSPAELVDEIVAAAVKPDPERVVRSVDHAFALLSAEEAIAAVLWPALDRIGELWDTGEATIAQEHQVTEVMRGKLVSLLNGAPRARAGASCSPACPASATSAGCSPWRCSSTRTAGRVVYLGADTPLSDAFELAQALEASAIGLSATLESAATAGGARGRASGGRLPIPQTDPRRHGLGREHAPRGARPPCGGRGGLGG